MATGKKYMGRRPPAKKFVNTTNAACLNLGPLAYVPPLATKHARGISDFTEHKWKWLRRSSLAIQRSEGQALDNGPHPEAPNCRRPRQNRRLLTEDEPAFNTFIRDAKLPSRCNLLASLNNLPQKKSVIVFQPPVSRQNGMEQFSLLLATCGDPPPRKSKRRHCIRSDVGAAPSSKMRVLPGAKPAKR